MGDYSTAQLFDLDKDGVLDLLLGERGGNIDYYRGQPGSPWMEFTQVTDSLGKINVTDPNVSLYGYSVPFFFRDKEDHTLLLVGSEQGDIFFYNDIDGNLGGKFSLSDTLGNFLGVSGLVANRGLRSAAVLGDLNLDGKQDMISGNFSGGLEYFSAAGSPPVSGIQETGSQDLFFRVYPNPARGHVTVEILSNQNYSGAYLYVTDVYGREVIPSTIMDKNTIELDMTSIPPGIYFIKLACYGTSVEYRLSGKKLILY